jgi:hypothetical protein
MVKFLCISFTKLFSATNSKFSVNKGDPFQSFASLVSNLTELEIFLEFDVFVCLNLKNMIVNAMKDQKPFQVFGQQKSNIVGQWKPIGVKVKF